jgi:hypothetical protein
MTCSPQQPYIGVLTIFFVRESSSWNSLLDSKSRSRGLIYQVPGGRTHGSSLSTPLNKLFETLRPEFCTWLEDLQGGYFAAACPWKIFVKLNAPSCRGRRRTCTIASDLTGRSDRRHPTSTYRLTRVERDPDAIYSLDYISDLLRIHRGIPGGHRSVTTARPNVVDLARRCV